MAFNLRRRTAALLVGAALGVGTLSACGTGTSPNTVAVIGNETITKKEYLSALDKAYADPVVGEQVKQMGSAYRTAYLNDMVTYQIAKQVAAKSGVAITDADIDAKVTELLGGQTVEAAQQASAAQGDPVTADQLRMRVARSLVNAEFGKKVTGKTLDEIAASQLSDLKAQRDSDPAQFTTYDVAVTVTLDQTLAADWVAKTNGGMSLADAVASNPDPNAAPGAQAVGEESVTGAQLSAQPDLLKQLQAIAPGQTGSIVQGPDQTGNFQYLVLTMKSISVTTDEELQQQAKQAADQQFLQAGAQESAKQAKSIKIDLNPRYGSVEVPAEGLPSVTVPKASTFGEPKSASGDATAPSVPATAPTG